MAGDLIPRNDADDSGYEGDPRYHLPRDTPLITPERAAKGDVFTGPPCPDCKSSGKVKAEGVQAPCRRCRGRGWLRDVNAAAVEVGHIRHAEVHEASVLNSLWSGRHITDQQHHDGGTFQVWRDMHRAQMGLDKSVSSGGDEAIGVRLRSYGYILILRRLNRHDHDTIDASLQPMSMPWAEWIARHCVSKYVAALDRLSRILPPIKDQIAHLEGLPEHRRDELSEEAIKKLLEVIKYR